MRLSLFRQKSNNSSPSPSSPKKSNRLSNILSPARFKTDSTEQQSQQQPLSPSALTSNQRPATSPPLNPLPSPENTPPPTQSLNQHLSSDGPTLPTSEPDHSFTTSNGSVQRPDYKQPRSEGRPEPRRQYQPTNGFEEFTSSGRAVRDDPAQFSTHVSQGSASTLRENTQSSRGDQRNPNDRSRQAYSSLSSNRYDRSVSNPISSPNQTFQTPATRLRPMTRSQPLYDEDDQLDWGDSSFSQSLNRDRLSSPSADAAQRSKQRAASSQAWLDSIPTNTHSWSHSNGLSPKSWTSSKGPSSNEPSRVSSQHLMSQPRSSVGQSLDGNNEPSTASKSTSKRPTYLKDHQASQRTSSHSVRSRESDATVGADDMTTNGGRTPGSNLDSRQLSRLPSFGSIASSASGDTETGGSRGHKRSRSSTMQATSRGNLQRVVENRERTQSPNITPKARAPQATGPDPSDTVVAQHVRNVEVPETVARQYRASQTSAAPSNNRFLTSSPYRPQGASNFSLKEQNSKVDKLTKENFDLKLKIHFLYQALEDRSDEGVSELKSKYAQLQAESVSQKKDIQQLRKRNKELERQNDGRLGPASSIAPSHLESEDEVSSRFMEEERGYIQQDRQYREYKNMQLTRNSSNQGLLDRLEHERSEKEHAQREVDELKRQLSQMINDSSSRPCFGSRNFTRDLPEGQRFQSKLSRVESKETDSLSGTTAYEYMKDENDRLTSLLLSQEQTLKSRSDECEGLRTQMENLKLLQRRGEGISPGSTGGDSILDRSVSRAQNRSASRASGSTRGSQLSDRDRERLESNYGMLRDENSLLKMRLQDLQRELDNSGASVGNVRRLQQERDEAIDTLKEADNNLEIQADEIVQLEDMVLQREDDVKRHLGTIGSREDELESLRAEIQKINREFDEVIEDSENSQAANQSLREDITRATGELEVMEDKLREVTGIKERLEVQQESGQSEIHFLREEQESDKMKLSDLQVALRNATSNARNHTEQSRHFEEMERSAAQAREDGRQLRRLLSQRETELKFSNEKLDDATATVEEFSANFDGARASYTEDIKKLQSDIRHLTRGLERARNDLNEKDQLLGHRDTLLESSNHETRSLNDMLSKERQGRKHDRNEFDRALHRARGTPEAKFLELEKSRETDRQKVFEMERELNDQVQRRNRLLQTVWNRLSTISNSERLAEQQSTLESTDHVSEELPSLMRRLPITLDAISSHISSFRSKIRDTERDISQDFQNLSEALSDRSARLETLEMAVANRSPTVAEPSAGSDEKYGRLKVENKLLRREIKHLKQGSFSLPGLPSAPGEPAFNSFQPTLTTTQESPSPSKEEHTAEDDAMPSPSVFHGPRARENGKSLLRQSSALIRPQPTANSEASSPSTVRHHSSAIPQSTTTNGDTRGGSLRSISATNLLQTSQNFQNNYDGTTETTSALTSSQQPQDLQHHQNHPVPRRSSSAQAAVNLNYKPEDRTWWMRLEELHKRVRLEREGRLHDRDAARKRLKEGEAEREELRVQLRRERDRGRWADVGAGAGVGVGSQEGTAFSGGNVVEGRWQGPGANGGEAPASEGGGSVD